MAKKVVKKKRKNNKRILMICLVLILLIIILVIVKKQENEVPNNTMLIISNQDVTDNLENDMIIKDEIIYISFEDIKKYLDQNIYQEGKNLIITTSDKKVAKLEIDKDEIIINGSKISIEGQPFKNEQNKVYIPISEMKNVYDIDLSYNKESKIITIDYYSKELIKAYAKKNITIKSEKSKSSQTIEKVKKGNWLIYISEEDGWAKVRTQNGKIGYIKYKSLTNFVKERENMKLESSTKENEQYLEKDITKENISTYKEREKLINTILNDTVNKSYTAVKIKYENDSNQYFERFQLEVKPILKECGISVVFN